mgnify:CR=1 FL=1
MFIQKFDNEKDWLSEREGLITGTKLKGLLPKQRGNGYRAGFYQLIAERIAVPPTNENPMDRGKRLEEIAIEEFEKKTKKKVNKDLVIWHRDDDERIAISPDGFIGKKEAIEVKCLSSAQFIEAWLTKKIPAEYEAQVIQYFIVNEDLQKLYFTFYDPRMPKPLFWIEVKRKEVQDKVDEYLQLEREALKKIDEIEKEFTF